MNLAVLNMNLKLSSTWVHDLWMANPLPLTSHATVRPHIQTFSHKFFLCFRFTIETDRSHEIKLRLALVLRSTNGIFVRLKERTRAWVFYLPGKPWCRCHWLFGSFLLLFSFFFSRRVPHQLCELESWSILQNVQLATALSLHDMLHSFLIQSSFLEMP